jgi:hypothetical protein
MIGKNSAPIEHILCDLGVLMNKQTGSMGFDPNSHEFIGGDIADKIVNKKVFLA